MSSTTTLGPPAVHKAAGARATRQAQRAFTGGVLKVFRGYLALVVVGAAVLGYVLARNGVLGTDLHQSAFDLVYGYSKGWVALSLGLMIPAALLRVHVAAGGSRQSFVFGAWRGAMLVGAVTGAVATAAFLAERAAYGAAELPWERVNGPAADSPAGFLFLFAGEALSTAVYLLVGTGITMAYYRWSIWRATAAVVPLLVPAVVVDIATQTGLVGGILGVHLPLPSPWASLVGVAVALLALHLSWLAAWLVARGVALPPNA